MAGGDGFQVDTESVRQAAQGLQDSAQALGDRWGSMLGYVQGLGDVFGDDMVGGLIGSSHQAAFGMVDDSLRSVYERLADWSQGLALMAAEYDATEQQNVADINSVGAT